MKELNSLLGNICIQFSQLEFFLCVACSKLMGSDANIGFIITSECSFGRLTAMFKSVIHYLTDDAELREQTEAIVARLSESEQRRNTAMHSLWMIQQGGQSPFVRMKVTAKVRHGLRQQWQNTTSEELTATAEYINATWQALLSFDSLLVRKGLSRRPDKGLFCSKQ